MKTFLFTLALGLAVATTSGQTTSNPPALENQPDTVVTDYELLDDVVVVANKKIVKSDGATTTYDVREDPQAKGETLLELLRRVPGVTVDAQDNIRINGQSDFRIMVNGHDDPSLSKNASLILKMMPANAISKIEVISEPGAKYDAEGSGGILNFVITADTDTSDGYTGTLSLQTGNRQWAPGINFRFKKQKVTTSIHAEYAGSIMDMKNYQHQQNWYTNTNTNANPIGYTDVITNQNVAFRYIGAGISSSWEISSNDLFTFNTEVNDVNASLKDGNTCEMAFTSPEGNKLYNYAAHINGYMRNLTLSTQGSYSHTFNDKGHNIVLTYLFNYGRSPLKINQDNYEFSGIFQYPVNDQLTLNFDRMHTAQIDYTLPFLEKHTLEMGLKGAWARNTGIGYGTVGFDRDQLSTINYSDVAQQKDVMAAYISYLTTFGHLSLKAGLRYEYTHMELSDNTAGMPGAYPFKKFTKTLNDPVPNAALTWSFSPVHNIRLGYQMRISRPSIQQANPAEFSLMNQIRRGNPDLTSQRENKISLTYTQFAGKIGGNIGIDYSRTSNVITDYMLAEEGRIIDTYANLGRRNEAGINGMLNWSPMAGTNIGANGRISWYEYKSVSPNVYCNRFIGNYTIYANTLLPGKVGLNVYGGQGTGWAAVQTRTNGWYYYGMGLNRKFLPKDALTVGINAGNFLTSGHWMFITTETDTFKHRQSTRTQQWSVQLSASWTFGNLKSDVKKIDVDAGFDDTVKSENHGSTF